jgi:hypothetical protein
MSQTKERKRKRSKTEVRKIILGIIEAAGGQIRWKDLEIQAAQRGLTAMTVKRSLNAMSKEGLVLPVVKEVNGKPARFYAIPEKLLPEGFDEAYALCQEKVRQISNYLADKRVAKSKKRELLAQFFRRLLEVRKTMVLDAVRKCSEITDDQEAAQKFLHMTLIVDNLTDDQIFSLCRGYPEIGLEVCSHLLEELQQVEERRVRGAMTQVPKKKGGDVK